jgi:hypothetical protein
MTGTIPRWRVALFDSRMDVMTLLRDAFSDGGFETVVDCAADIQTGVLDLVAFMAEHDPHAIVWDLPRPMERHLNFLRLLLTSELLKRRVVVLTTTDSAALEAASGGAFTANGIFEVPYRIADVVGAVQRGVRALHPGGARQPGAGRQEG